MAFTLNETALNVSGMALAAGLPERRFPDASGERTATCG